MILSRYKKFTTISLLCAVVALGTLSFRQAPEHPAPKNLKILPKNISHEQLIAIMHDFEHALNYHCGDCHAASQTNPKRLDFASDANPKKNVARKMIKMMMRINKKNFNIKGDFAQNYVVNAKYNVTCYTCHHGSEHPMKFPAATPGDQHGPAVR